MRRDAGLLLSENMDQKQVAECCLDLLNLETVEALERKADADGSDRSVIYPRLEGMGFGIGHRFVERHTRSRTPRLSDPLDIVKFLCKDLWTELFRKKIDKLQTNHRGVYVLQVRTAVLCAPSPHHTA